MRLMLKKLRNHLAKGPLIEKVGGQTYMFKQNELTLVPDDVGYALLKMYPDLLEKSKIPKKDRSNDNKGLEKYRNKMMSSSEIKDKEYGSE